MENQSHTPEPWRLLRYLVADDCVTVYGADDGLVVTSDVEPDCHMISRASARRIVACVNACAGIPTEALEAALALPKGAPDRLRLMHQLIDETQK